jgi:hypothetical protein
MRPTGYSSAARKTGSTRQYKKIHYDLVTNRNVGVLYTAVMTQYSSWLIILRS